MFFIPQMLWMNYKVLLFWQRNYFGGAGVLASPFTHFPIHSQVDTPTPNQLRENIYLTNNEA